MPKSPLFTEVASNSNTELCFEIVQVRPNLSRVGGFSEPAFLHFCDFVCFSLFDEDSPSSEAKSSSNRWLF